MNCQDGCLLIEECDACTDCDHFDDKDETICDKCSIPGTSNPCFWRAKEC